MSDKQKEIYLIQELIRHGIELMDKNLVIGPGGNISFRLNDLMFITPSGLSFDELNENDIVQINIETKEIIKGDRKPSSEAAMHRDIYINRSDVNYIIHTHPPITIAISGAGAKIRPLYPDFALLLGNEIPVIDYVTPCTQILADKISEIITDNNVIIMKKHGLVTVGKSFKEALVRTFMVEESAKMIVAARSIGKEEVMTEKEIKEMNSLKIEKYRKKLIEKES